MYSCVPHNFYVRFPDFNSPKIRNGFSSFRRDFRVFASSSAKEASNYIPAAPIFLPEGPWKQIPGGVTAAKGFKAAGMYGGLRAQGEKPDLALVICDVDAISAGAFTTNVVAAAPVVYCKNALYISKTVASLLHDDILDDADTRRRIGSLNLVMGNKVVSLIATVVEHLGTGETMQMTTTSGQRCSMEYYLQKTYLKTASLISNSCQAIALLAGQSAEVSMVAFEYGKNLIVEKLVDIITFIHQEILEIFGENGTTPNVRKEPNKK